jgi:5'-nucleotidase
MRILVTNDDGVHAEGLKALVRELGREHEILVLAPDRERSGVSHAMTLRDPGKIRKLGEREYSCSGTPADCVILAGLGAVDFEPELVVSGINRGPNIGTDIVYSGTCGAARQAVLGGVPGIAVSCASYGPELRYGAAATFVRRNLPRLAGLCDGEVFVNINAPSSDEECLEAEWTVPSERHYRDRLQRFDAPDGFLYCFLADSKIETSGGEGSDHRAVSGGRIAISRIIVKPQAADTALAGRAFV